MTHASSHIQGGGCSHGLWGAMFPNSSPVSGGRRAVQRLVPLRSKLPGEGPSSSLSGMRAVQATLAAISSMLYTRRRAGARGSRRSAAGNCGSCFLVEWTAALPEFCQPCQLAGSGSSSFTCLMRTLREAACLFTVLCVFTPSAGLCDGCGWRCGDVRCVLLLPPGMLHQSCSALALRCWIMGGHQTSSFHQSR